MVKVVVSTSALLLPKADNGIVAVDVSSESWLKVISAEVGIVVELPTIVVPEPPQCKKIKDKKVNCFSRFNRSLFS